MRKNPEFRKLVAEKSKGKTPDHPQKKANRKNARHLCKNVFRIGGKPMITRLHCKIFWACLILATSHTPLEAHHANSAYDRLMDLTVSGTVTKWQFINPHAGLWLTVINDRGASQEWSVEFQGTLDLYRHYSFNKDTFRPGDEITLIGNPARNGDPDLSARIVIFSDGKEVDVRNIPD